MNWNSCSSFKTQILPLSMHHKWKEIIGTICKTTDGKSYGTNSQQKVPFESKNDSIEYRELFILITDRLTDVCGMILS